MPNAISYDFPAMTVIPQGRIMMGAPEREPGALPGESPQRLEVIERPFALALHAVTVAQYRQFLSATNHNTEGIYQVWDGRDWLARASAFDAETLTRPADQPAVHVSWNDAQHYIGWLTSVTGTPFRLPTEAEWEYAARAGTATAYPWGNQFDSSRAHVRSVAKSEAFFGGPVSVVAQKPNAFGLHHMLGNVWEWVADRWQPPGSGDKRVVRGGSWLNGPNGVRAARRHAAPANMRRADIGFRVAATLASA